MPFNRPERGLYALGTPDRCGYTPLPLKRERAFRSTVRNASAESLGSPTISARSLTNPSLIRCLLLLDFHHLVDRCLEPLESLLHLFDLQIDHLLLVLFDLNSLHPIGELGVVLSDCLDRDPASTRHEDQR